MQHRARLTLVHIKKKNYFREWTNDPTGPDPMNDPHRHDVLHTGFFSPLFFVASIFSPLFFFFETQ